MKAALFKAIGQPLVVERVADPTPAADQVVIAVERCGICGTDLHITESPLFAMPPDSVLGHEFAGRVVAIGRDCSRIRIGDPVAVQPVRGCGRCAACLAGDPAICAARVVGGGGYAELALVDERQCAILPKTLSLADAALVEPLAVGLHGLNIGCFRPGSRVLVLGAGPIGIATIFWARRLGAGRIGVIARSTRGEAISLATGADAFMADGPDVVPRMAAALGGAPDLVIECVGAEGLIAKAVEHVRPRGTIVVQGVCTGIDQIMPFWILRKEIRIQASYLYTMAEFEHAAAMLDRHQADARIMVTDMVTLEELPAAFEALRQRTHQCKVLVKPNA